MSQSRSPLLPQSVEAELYRLPWRGFGLTLLLLAVVGWTSLLTWSFHDPSLNHAADGKPHNFLGGGGSALADLMLQSAGLAAITFFGPPAIWGWRILNGMLPERLRMRLIYWALSVLLLASALSALPAPKSWLLGNGLGGMIGDSFAGVFLRIGGFIEPSLAAVIGGMLAAYGGLWTLLRAVELRFRDLVILLRRSPRKHGGPRGSKIGLKLRLWTALLRCKMDDLKVKKAGGPREYWMGPGLSGGGLGNWRGYFDRSEGEGPRSRSAGQSDESSMREEDSGGIGSAHGLNGASRAGSYSGAPRGGLAMAENCAPGGAFADSCPPLSYRITRNAEAERQAGAADASIAAPRYQSAQSRGGARGGFTLPSHHLLGALPRPSGHGELSDETLEQQAALLETVLADFGVKGRITGVRPGPVITLHELEPARGTKSSRVIGLADDIARSMSAVSARVAVIPGRDAIGIELPNDYREIVYLRELLEAEAFTDAQSQLPLALGKTIGGEPIVADLARMPHLLIAGTTGSGKSVGINTMVLSLLFRLPPDQCKFIMIDPKMLELSVYDGIPHLLTPVVTDPRKAITALKWTVNEMNARYERMCKLGVRNIGNYNQKVTGARAAGSPLVRTVHTGFDYVSGSPVYEQEDMEFGSMPYIVVVIDEMADLMMVAGKEIEYAVQRLSQMARAAGIHLIMATQRPSVDVITGTIKANFPCRISFQVTSKIDSRTILGEQGAEQLLGAGDLLFMATGGRIMRAHGPFVADEQVERVVKFLKSQGAPEYLDAVLEAADEAEEAPDGETAEPAFSGDLYGQAVAIVVKERKPTTSYLQRRLGIGYNRAASLIERMEQEGLISEPNRTGKREVLVKEPD